MVIAESCGVTLVYAILAIQLQCSESSLIKRLSEWCYDAKDKKRGQAPRTGGEHLFCAVVAVDPGMVAS
jgi:hypothetical protein